LKREDLGERPPRTKPTGNTRTCALLVTKKNKQLLMRSQKKSSEGNSRDRRPLCQYLIKGRQGEGKAESCPARPVASLVKGERKVEVLRATVVWKRSQQ